MNMKRSDTISTSKAKVAYTFLFGDYDDLKPPTVITPGWDYICFTDNPLLISDVWDIRLSLPGTADRQLDNKKYAMKHLILSHQYLGEYALSFSIGAQIQINCDLDDLLHKYFQEGDDMMICRHPERDCIYDEAEICKALLLDDPVVIDEQVQRYRSLGYPAHNGLFVTGIIVRRHDRENVRNMCFAWWNEYRHGSRRDQLSLNYAIWKSTPINISIIDYHEQFVTGGNFNVYNHKRRIHLDGTNIKILFDSQRKPASSAVDYVGHIDAVNRYGIRGWGADRARLNESISVSLYDNNALMLVAQANQLRPDVGIYLGDNGLHGFTIPFPAGFDVKEIHNLSLRFEASDIYLGI